VNPGRYRKIFVRVWRHSNFRGLSRPARELFFYLLTGPQSNRIGLFNFSIAKGAEDLDVGVPTFRKALTTVCTAFGWLFDADAGVFYIPSWWRWNRPQNPDHLKGNLKDLNEIPASELVEAFARNLEHLPGTCHQTFVTGVAGRLSTRPPHQDLGSGSEQKREREQRASRGTDEDDVITPEDRRAASETIRDAPEQASPDYYVDHFKSAHPGGRRLKRSTIESLLHEARLSEHRVRSIA